MLSLMDNLFGSSHYLEQWLDEEPSQDRTLMTVVNIIKEVLSIDRFISPKTKLKEDLEATDAQYHEIIERSCSACNCDTPGADEEPETMGDLVRYLKECRRDINDLLKVMTL